jgi:WW domain
MVNARLARITWLLPILTGRVYLAAAFMTVSPPSSSQCMARSALMDPFTSSVASSDDASSTKEPTFHAPARQSHLNVLEQLWQSAASLLDSSSSASAFDSANPSPTQWQQPLDLLGQLWTAAIQFLNAASEPRTADVMLVEQGEWQAYQCTASRDSFYSYARGHVYYFNTLTGESQWERPHSNFPTLQALPLPNGYDFLDAIPVVATASRAKQSATALWATSKDNSNEPSSSPASDKPTSWWDMLMGSISEILPSNAKSNEQTDVKQSRTDMEENSAIDEAPKPWWSVVFDGFKQLEPQVRPVESSSSAPPSNIKEKKEEDSWWWTFSAQSVNDNVSNETTTPSIPTSDSSLVNPILASRTEPPSSPWDILFGNDDKEKKVSPQLNADSAQTDTLPDNTSSEEQQHSPSLLYSEWVENLSLYLTKDTSRTRSLFSLKNVPVVGAIIAPDKATASPSAPASSLESSPSQKTGAAANPNTSAAIREAREKALQEKRYAASVARQANLRKNYDEVILDRSPTISLTAMKKSNKPASKTWFRYLED